MSTSCIVQHNTPCSRLPIDHYCIYRFALTQSGPKLVIKRLAPGQPSQQFSVDGSVLTNSGGLTITNGTLLSNSGKNTDIILTAKPKSNPYVKLMPVPQDDIRFTDGVHGSPGGAEWIQCITPCKGHGYGGFGSCKIAGHAPDGTQAWGACKVKIE